MKKLWLRIWNRIKKLFGIREMKLDLNKYVGTDDALFHYTKLSVAIESILPTKKLKLSFLKDTNDPIENKFKFFNLSYEPGPGDEAGPRDSMNKILKEAKPIINKILLSESRVLCFCSNKKPTLILNDNNTVVDKHNCLEGWNKSRMWSQYGENHCGICLVFSKDGLEKGLKTKQHKKFNYKSGHVQYFQKCRIPWETITLNGDRAKTEGVEQYSRNHVIENSEEFFYRKHIDYRDEAEYRAVVFDPDGKLEYLDISSSIKGVIAGCETSEVYFPLIDQLSEQLEIEARHVYWSKSSRTSLLRSLQKTP